MIRRPPRSTPSNSSAASDVYKRQIQEEFDISKEAAQYAAQACVASKVFKEADESGEGDLDFEELRNLVRSCFSKNFLEKSETDSDISEGVFTEADIMSMTLYLMRAADENLNDRILYKNEKSLPELQRSKISLHQWQELCVAGVFERNEMQSIINSNSFLNKIK